MSGESGSVSVSENAIVNESEIGNLNVSAESANEICQLIQMTEEPLGCHLSPLVYLSAQRTRGPQFEHPLLWSVCGRYWSLLLL